MQPHIASRGGCMDKSSGPCIKLVAAVLQLASCSAAATNLMQGPWPAGAPASDPGFFEGGGGWDKVMYSSDDHTHRAPHPFWSRDIPHGKKKWLCKGNWFIVVFRISIFDTKDEYSPL